MDSLWAGISILCVLCAGMLVVWDLRRRAHEELAMRRMRGSQLYADLYQLVKIAQKYDLDEVRIERDRITFFTIQPVGCLGTFCLQVGGYRYLNPIRVKALTQVLALDLPELQSNSNYCLKKYKVMRPNGAYDDCFVYTARSAYKMRVLQSRRYAQLQKL